MASDPVLTPENQEGVKFLSPVGHTLPLPTEWGRTAQAHLARTIRESGIRYDVCVSPRTRVSGVFLLKRVLLSAVGVELLGANAVKTGHVGRLE